MSTYASLRDGGNGTCSGGIANRSAYWVPSLIDAGGVPVVPKWSFQYYKSGYRGVTPAEIADIPDGLRMIAGDPSATIPQELDIVSFVCASSPGATAKVTIVDCAAGDSLIMAVSFPQCWDGRNLDSPDHRAHMAYASPGVGCSDDHPIAIPVLTIHVEWVVPPEGFADARLASDHSGGAGGASAHADFIEAWDPEIRDVFTDACIRKGIDCEVRALGDGRQLVDPTPTRPSD
jgi:hypothetical protein